LAHDPRYDAVGSSSLREELFSTFLKGDNLSSSPTDKDDVASAQATALSKKEKKERAVREREQRVKAELTLVEKNIEQSRMGINREEGEREYRCALCFKTISAGASRSRQTRLGICSQMLYGTHR
jgi:hypothetical protein